jgi:hypothetical protein
MLNLKLECVGSPESENSEMKCGAVAGDVSWSEIGFRGVRSGCWYGRGVLSDLVCRLSAEVGLDKSLAVSTDVLLAGGSGEDNEDDLCGDGEESISSYCCGGPVTTEWFVGLAVVQLESAMISRRISAQRQSLWWYPRSSLSVIILVECP